MAKLIGRGILDLKYYFWTEAKIAGTPVVITRTGWTSEVGYEVYLTDSSRAPTCTRRSWRPGRRSA